MSKTLLRVVCGCRLGLFVTLVSLCLVLSHSGLVYGQVSESELNQLARDAASNRNTATTKIAPKTEIDFFDLMIKGGIFMIPIGFVSLTVVTFVFDRLIGLRSGKILPWVLRRSLLQAARQGELDPRDVYRICGESSSAAAKIFRTMVLKTGRPMPEMEAATSEATQRELDKAYSNVRWLNLSAGIAPLLGLLGTVWGLIRAFHDTTQLTAGQNRADFLAVGIYEALVTTLAGLIVAIPAAVASHYFEGKITRVFGAIEELSSELMMRLECYEGRTRFEPIGRELAARDLLHGGTVAAPPVVSTGLPNVSRAAKSELRTRTSGSSE
ncbi:MAG: MotA/TolQ/ExbB proton channel family protein [Planctomycetota bacterium]|nr:MotA/TolQ/ExbB proton channel family protein [Planctomycetota bacterium]